MKKLIFAAQVVSLLALFPTVFFFEMNHGSRIPTENIQPEDNTKKPQSAVLSLTMETLF